MTRKKKENPQKELSKEWISKALLALMKEKPYRQVSISEVSNRADLSRRTFYRHFGTLDEVLEHIINTISAEFAASFFARQQSDMKSVVLAYFQYWEAHKSFLFMLRQNDMLFLIQNNFLSAIRKRHGQPNRLRPMLWCKNMRFILHQADYGTFSLSGWRMEQVIRLMIWHISRKVLLCI